MATINIETLVLQKAFLTRQPVMIGRLEFREMRQDVRAYSDPFAIDGKRLRRKFLRSIVVRVERIAWLDRLAIERHREPLSANLTRQILVKCQRKAISGVCHQCVEFRLAHRAILGKAVTIVPDDFCAVLFSRDL